MLTIALIAQKGGTGKTTVARCLAVAFERSVQASAIIDMDPQASASLWAKRREADLPEVIPTVLPLLGDTLKAAEKSVKVALIDTPPKNADIAIAAAKAADLIIIPCRPQIDDIETLPATKQVLDVTGNKPTFCSPERRPSERIAFKRSRRFNNRPSGRCFHRVQAHLRAPCRIRGFFRSRPHASGI